MFLNKKKFLICSVWTYCALIGVVHFLQIGITERNFSNNIIYTALLLPLLFCLLKMFDNANRKEVLFSSIFSVFLSAILIIGAQIEYLNSVSWTFQTIFDIALLTLFWVPVISFIFYWCKEKSYSSFVSKIKWSKLAIFLLITGVWMVSYLALYPGIYDYDSINQTLQFLVTHNISGHHPVMHSFLLSLFFKIGEILADSYQLGLGLYSLVQLICLSYTAMQLSWFLYQRKRHVLFYLSLIFFLFFPLHYIMAVWATKDIFFTCFFALLSLEIIKFSENKQEYWKSKKNIFKFVALTVLMCMFRNNGVYALLVSLPIFVLCFRRSSVKLVAITVCSLGLFLLYQNVLLPVAGVTSGNMREMLSVPCQQLAKVYVERPDVFSDEEKEALFELIPQKNLLDYQYRPMISDATKNYFNTEQFNTDPQKYIKLYIKIGLRSPRKYIEAFLQNSLGFWYPNKSYPDTRLFHPYTEFHMADPNLFKGDYIYIERSSKLPGFEKLLEKIILDTSWTEFSGLSNFFVPGTYFIILCFIGLFNFYLKRWETFAVWGLWAAFWITLLISPVALVRYAYPVIFCLPLCGYMLFGTKPHKLR